MNFFVLLFIFPKFFFQNFFFNIFFPNFFFQIFSLQCFFLNFFSDFLKSFFFWGFHSMPPRLQRKNGLYVSVSWKIWFTASGRNWTSVMCDKVFFFGSCYSHHTRREKFNSFPATHNILLYFFRNLLYLIEVLKCFLECI